MRKGDASFVLKGDICYSVSQSELRTIEGGYLVCEEGVSAGAFESLPQRYEGLPVVDNDGSMIIPGLTDLHVHAPQFSFRGLGMDLELLDWLNTHTFPEEAKYADIGYAQCAYHAFVNDVRKGPNTRAVVFATSHVPATIVLMDMLEASGLVTMVGKVNIDRNSHAELQEASAEVSTEKTVAWLDAVSGKYRNTLPILTPRFIPACSDALMRMIAGMQREWGLPVQSHLSESLDEVEWVRTLCPEASSYADAYRRLGVMASGARCIMAHCVHSYGEEMDILAETGTFVAHCPQSNTNLSSGIAPVRKFLDRGLRVGLGSDVAGGSDTSILRVMADAVRVSKLYWRLVDSGDRPLSVAEAFYLGTLGSGSFFGKVGSFEPGYEFDAVVIDDASLAAPFPLSIADRLARIVYYADDRNIAVKYARGRILL